MFTFRGGKTIFTPKPISYFASLLLVTASLMRLKLNSSEKAKKKSSQQRQNENSQRCLVAFLSTFFTLISHQGHLLDCSVFYNAEWRIKSIKGWRVEWWTGMKCFSFSLSLFHALTHSTHHSNNNRGSKRRNISRRHRQRCCRELVNCVWMAK